MRALGLIGLLLALVIVGVLMKKQLGAAAGTQAVDAPARVQQPQQTQQQFKQSLDAAMQQPRPVPDDSR
jgi:hypothetical protein